MNILVTGGASGLGEAIVKEFSNAGHKVFFTYFSSAENAKKIEAACAGSKAVFCDFADQKSVEALLAQISSFDPDVLVNNAIAGMTKKHFHKTDHAEFSGGFMRNVMPVIRITQAAILLFRTKKSGRIITILSAAGVSKPPVGWSEYVAAKAYLEALSRSWAAENIAFGITSNCISPSFMKTGLTGDTDERIIDAMIDQHPLKRLLKTEEVAAVVHDLARSSAHMNGVNLVMNAGDEMK